MAPELTSGRYDDGLAAAVMGDAGTQKSPSFTSILASYRRPASVTEAATSYVPQLVDAQAYRFIHYVDPEYPRIAVLARVQSKIDLQLTVVPETGEVLSASVISGNPLLSASAIQAATQWRFASGSITSSQLTLTLDFLLRCQ